MTEPLWRRYLRFWRPDVDADVHDELRFHLDMRASEYEARGLPPDEARHAAAARFGDVESVARWLRDHDRRRARAGTRRETMHELLQDLRYALRGLAARPGFTAVTVLTLALGVGVTAAVFGVVNTVLLRPLPYAHADRAVVLWNAYERPAMPRSALSPAEFADFREQLGEVEGLSAVADWTANLTGTGEPRRLQGFMVSPTLFATLGASPALGRGFLAGTAGRNEDAETGATPAVVLSHDLWRTVFGADRALLGRTIRLNDAAFTVVGVMPPGVRFPDSPSFLFPDRADLWVAHDWGQDRADPRGNKFLRMAGRLRPGVSIERAQQALDGVAARLQAQHPATYPAEMGWRPSLVPLPEQVVGDVRPAMGALAGAAALVLLIACVNVANLLLARGASRGHEIAVRAALGAGRGRIVRQLLTESLVLALAGGALGVVVAALALRVLVAYAPASVPRLDQAGVDGAVFAIAVVASVATAVLFGLSPAIRQSRAELYTLVKAGGRGTAGRVGRAGLGRVLVATEVALALVVLVGAGLLLRTVQQLRAADIGFAGEGVLAVRLSLPESKYASGSAQTAFFRDLLARVAALPGVTVAGAGHPLPLSGDAWDGAFVAEGHPLLAGQPYPNAEYGFATPGFFRALGIPLRAGRTFTDGDDEHAPEVVVVDDELARRYWPGESAIGRRLSLAGRPDSAWATIVGVVGHVRRAGARVDGGPQIYVPVGQRPQGYMAVVLRTTGDPLQLAPALRRTVAAVDPEQPITDLRAMTDLTARSTARDRFTLALLAAFALLATFLAAVGVYGVVAAGVAQRAREFGVRVALGARPGDVVRLVVREGMVAALAGVAAGLVVAAAAARAVHGLLFGVAGTDAATYAATAALLAATALLACALPAYRAARADPVRALQSD